LVEARRERHARTSMYKLKLVDERVTPRQPAAPQSASAKWRWNPDAKLIRKSNGEYEIPNFSTATAITVDAQVGKLIARVSGLTVPFALPAELSDGVVHALQRGKFIITADRFDEYQRLTRERIARMLHGSHGFIIMPTKRCNFRCTYCYESFDQGRMKPELVEAMSRAIRLRA